MITVAVRRETGTRRKKERRRREGEGGSGRADIKI